MTHTTRRDWVEIVVMAIVGGPIIHWLGYAAWAVAAATFLAGWLYGRYELRREMRRDILAALTKDPDHAA